MWSFWLFTCLVNNFACLTPDEHEKFRLEFLIRNLSKSMETYTLKFKKTSFIIGYKEDDHYLNDYWMKEMQK